MNPLAHFLCFAGVVAAVLGSGPLAIALVAAALLVLVVGAQPPRLP